MKFIDHFKESYSLKILSCHFYTEWKFFFKFINRIVPPFFLLPLPRFAFFVRSFQAWEAGGLLREMLDAARPAVEAVRAQFPLQPVEAAAGRDKKRYWFAADVADIALDSYAKVCFFN